MHDFTSAFLQALQGATVPPSYLLPVGITFALLMVWTLFIKGYALWHAARHEQKWWYIALLVVNTFGILEIVYLIWFRPSDSDQLEVSS